MNNTLAVLCFVVGVLMMVLVFPDGFTAVLMVFVCSAIIIYLMWFALDETSTVLIQIFLIALLVRLIFGLALHLLDQREFFGGDAETYDSLGYRLVEIWFYNYPKDNFWSQIALSTSGPGWGMSKLVGGIYSITGRNIFAAQSFCAVIGAAIAPMTYTCARKIFNNHRVSYLSAMFVAVFPAFVIWTSQLLKDGLIIFLLVLSMIIVMRLQEKFRYFDLLILIIAQFGIISLRFYIFYVAAVAIMAAFIIGTSDAPSALIRRLVAVILLGISLTYFGFVRDAGTEFETYGNLEKVQTTRQNLAASAGSGYGEDIDVSTTEGAAAALPIGFIYLMFAPFPWDMISSFRQFSTLPDVLIWWASLPFLVSGLIYTIRNRLRKAIPILVFSILLTIAYSIGSGNVGTAYRQRTQIQVFFFMFVAAGWKLRKEKVENDRLTKQIGRKRFLENKQRAL